MHGRPVASIDGAHLEAGLHVEAEVSCGEGGGGADWSSQQDPGGEHPARARRRSLPPLAPGPHRGGRRHVLVASAACHVSVAGQLVSRVFYRGVSLSGVTEYG